MSALHSLTCMGEQRPAPAATTISCVGTMLERSDVAPLPVPSLGSSSHPLRWQTRGSVCSRPHPASQWTLGRLPRAGPCLLETQSCLAGRGWAESRVQLWPLTQRRRSRQRWQPAVWRLFVQQLRGWLPQEAPTADPLCLQRSGECENGCLRRYQLRTRCTQWGLRWGFLSVPLTCRDVAACADH